MSTAATTAPAPLTILSQLLLSISPLLRSWGLRSVWPVEDMVVRERRRLSGRRTRLRLGPAGTMPGSTGGDRRSSHFGYARLMSGRNAPGDGDRRLIEAGMVLASELSLDAVLLRIVELAVDLTGARYGALGVLTPDGRSIDDFIAVGITPEERAALGDPPVGHGLLGALTRSPHPIRIPDIGADPRSVGFPPNHPPMTSLLGARIIGRGTVFGNLYLTDKQAAEMF